MDNINVDYVDEEYKVTVKPEFIKASEFIDFTELLGEGNDKLITNTGVS